MLSSAVIVGPAPSQFSDASSPLSGRSGAFLAELMGIPFKHYLDRFQRVNLLDEWPGKTGKGDAFDLAAAVVRANEIKIGFKTRRPPYVLMLGRNVARAFGINALGLDFFEGWISRAGTAFYLLPHPSGINLFWNEPSNMRMAKMFLRRIVL